MANIKDLIQSIESGDSSFDEKLAAINAMEETLVAMRAQEQSAIDDNVAMIVEAIAVMQRKVEAQLEVAKAIVPEIGPRGPKGEPGERGLDGANGRDGRDGVDGRNGVDGQDGVSVTDAKIDFDGSLVITLSTGREINVGEVVAPDLAEKIKLVTSGGGTSQQVLDTLASLQTQIDTLIPSQTGNAGKYLTTDGTSTSWATVAGGGAVDSVNGQTGAVSLDAADVGAEPADATILKDADIGVTVQGYNANTVIDASYVHTDNNYTTTEKSKLAGIAAGAEVNVNADWNAVSGDAQILNKPTLYSDASVDTHLNTSTATSTQILSWTGTDYDWINQPGGSALTVQDEGSTLTSAATSLNFTGAGVTATNTGGAVTIDIPGGGGGGSTSPIPNLSAWMIGAM